VVVVERLARRGAALGRRLAHPLRERLVVGLLLGGRLALDVNRSLLGLPCLPAVPALGEFDLELCRVSQDDLGQVRGRAGRVDGAPEARPRQRRDTAAVIEMGVGQEDGVERIGLEGERHAIALDLFR
jgi:hypothetical protein